MLESQAASLEALIKTPKGKGKTIDKGAKTIVTWDSPVELDNYIAKLQVFQLNQIQLTFIFGVGCCRSINDGEPKTSQGALFDEMIYEDRAVTFF